MVVERQLTKGGRKGDEKGNALRACACKKSVGSEARYPFMYIVMIRRGESSSMIDDVPHGTRRLILVIVSRTKIPRVFFTH